MHSLLENYLSELSTRLEALPEKHRTDELNEMREHLQTAVASSVEQGHSEDDAAASVTAQFGAPQMVGEKTVYAWERGEMRRKRIFWGVTLFANLGMYGAAHLQRTVLMPRLMLLMSHKPMPPGYSGIVNSGGFVMTRGQIELIAAADIVFILVSSILVAGICGIAFPKIAVKAVLLSNLLGFGYDIVMRLYGIIVVWRPYTLNPATIDWGSEARWLPLALPFMVVSCGIMVLAAWMASCWRQRRGSSLRPVST